jgi:predicted transposase/invertase (TIGR01784 family)
MDRRQNSELLSPHNNFFKGMFSKPEVAVSYIQKFLHINIWHDLPLDKLKLANTSYITDELKAYYSDIVWMCPYKDSEISIAFLFEHKSYQPKFPHIQLLRYMLQLWEQDITQNRKLLRPVIPILVYQGHKKWIERPMQDYFPDFPFELKKYLPMFEYELNDLQRIPENDLLSLGSRYLTLALYSMANYKRLLKTIKTIDNICLIINRLENIDENTNFVEQILVYLMKTNDINKSKMKELLEKSKSKTLQQAKTTYEQFIEEGIEIGIEKGLEKGLELAIIKAYNSGQSVEFIAKMFDISLEKVENIVQNQ